jgi:RNA polymerase sigma-70 factor (ECF subfamily)
MTEMTSAVERITKAALVGTSEINRGAPGGADARSDRLAELLGACASGDRAAFKDLYDETSRLLFGIVVTVLRDREIAQEVTQEVYVTIWRKAASFDVARGNPLPWMRSIARNRAIDRIRAERARGFVQYTDEVPDIADIGPGAETSLDAVVVRRALEKLRPEYRKALLLSYFKGYTNAELAELLDIPVGTAKTWLRRGLQDLKAELG